jgi:hypothetical protein
MRTKLIPLLKLFTVLFLANNMFGQDVVSKSALKEAETAHLKNTVITIDNKNFDYRVLKHYSEDELRTMSSIKRNQVHFIYTQSYIVLDLANCPNLKETDIDVAKIEVFRKENTSSTVFYGKDCKVSVKLISRNEMQELMNVLNNTKQ